MEVLQETLQQLDGKESLIAFYKNFRTPPPFPKFSEGKMVTYHCVHIFIIDFLIRGWYIVISHFYSVRDWTQLAKKYVISCRPLSGTFSVF